VGAVRTMVFLLTTVAMLVAMAVPTQADQGATQAAAGAIKAKLPAVGHLFVNCPEQNAITAPDGSTGIGCEWRGIASGAVRTGSLTVTLANGQWHAADLHVSRPLPRQWRSCSRRGLAGHKSGQNPTRLDVHGVGCSTAKLLANDIGERVLLQNLRVPRRFTEAWHGPHTAGFVIDTFRCRGAVRLDHEGGYAHETARCANRFGDRFVYGFAQHE